MKKKEPLIIALDMDGTLLNDKKKISLKTLFLLRKLNKKENIHVLFSSGRPSRALWKYYKLLKLDTPMICYNGAYVFHPYDKDFPTHAFEFPRKLILEVNDKLKSHIKNIMCETDTEIWCDVKDEYLAKFFWFNDMDVHYGELKDTLTKDPMTCIVQTPYEYRDDRQDIDKILEKYPEIGARFWTGSPYFELCYKDVSKGAALKKIADYYHVKRENVIAFGDSTNDIEMFDFAGTSVVMSNGKDNIKNADMVSLRDNNHNGIYCTLKKILNA